MSNESARRKADELAQRLTESRPRNWAQLVDQWARFVAEVEAGYQLTIYDYHNDLDVRGTIDDVLGQLSADDRQAVETNVREFDERFLVATREGNEVVATYDRGFWARRIPTKLVGELAVDLAPSNDDGEPPR